MKHKLFSLALLLTPILLLSQTESKGKFTGGLQVNPFVGVIYTEYMLTTQSAIRFEAGLQTTYSQIDKNLFFDITPTLNLEPRWYYNLNKREANDRNVLYNSANFLGLRVGYRPNWFVISNRETAQNLNNRFEFIPKWGIRRTVLKRINYELGFGLGYYLSQDSKEAGGWESGVALDFHIRLGVNLY